MRNCSSRSSGKVSGSFYRCQTGFLLTCFIYSSRPRPSRALIQGLQEDLDELRDFVENLKHCTEPERSELLSAWKRNGPTPTPSRAVSLVHPDTSISQARRDVSPSDLHVTQQMHVAIDVRF